MRATYLYSGMTELAAATGDKSLLQACRRLFDSIANARMYITGGIGSTFDLERFTVDYDLANGSLMYAESCAAIGLSMFCQRMANLTGEEKYAEIMERAIFNGILSGINFKGNRYFYTNYLEVDENLKCYNCGASERQPWFSCSCCPTNFARYLTQLQHYTCAVDQEAVTIHIPVPMQASIPLANGERCAFELESNYPYDGNLKLTVRQAGRFALRLRIPSWCHEAEYNLNGSAQKKIAGGRYLNLRRSWKPGDTLNVILPMPVRFLNANSKVTGNAGRLAVMRGPLVYCVEELDCPCPVRELVVDPTAETKLLPGDKRLPQGTMQILLQGWQEIGNPRNSLYFEEELQRKPVSFRATPYALWQNRGKTNMAVWLRR